ncbi:hypothetical protein [Acetonema longum]|uniref:Putative phage portal protein n=1 Tax=Acetonema longum DSM 6540 TaxID=1009370 RepID=F7NK66_9FIRM|nr:hypothetical protein [Acetonema longum]EGO63507.1 putative phage portal protein [Acetonema longum DSM 6540]
MAKVIPISVGIARRWFKDAVDGMQDWRREAREDYEFYFGIQWDEGAIDKLRKQGRPVITINRVKPTVNLLSGYQRLNRYEPSFKPRTADDLKKCKVREGMTNFVFDASDFESEESDIFLDAAIAGRGFAKITYEVDYDTMDGEAQIKRVSPFSMYVDPECRKADLSDAKFVCEGRWVDKDEAMEVYPEHAEAIEQMVHEYDTDEQDSYGSDIAEPLWYQKDGHKVRLIEMWYRQKRMTKFFVMQDDSLLPQSQVQINMLSQMVIVNGQPQTVEKPQKVVRVKVMLGQIELEDIESPYQHRDLPYAQLTAYYIGEGDTPSGVVRNMKDSQREINKRRSQRLHILNTQANSGWIAEDGALTPEQEQNIRNFGATPGVVVKHQKGSSLQRITPSPYPTNVAEEEQISTNDIRELTGINEAMMGSQDAAGQSGRAIELRQKQAITHVAALFDNLRKFKRRILYLLWGKRNCPGIIPQYYTESKTIRIIGEDGHDDFIQVNDAQVIQDPNTGQWFETTINDLSVGEFDIVITDTPSTATQRMAQYYMLLEAVKAGIPVPPDVILEESDIPRRDEIARRIREEKEAQAQAAAQEAQAKQQPQTNPPRISLNYRDLPPDGKMQAAAQAGIQIQPPVDMGQIVQQAQALQQQLATLPPEQQMAIIQQLMMGGGQQPVMQQQMPQQGQVPPMPQSQPQGQGMPSWQGPAIPQNQVINSMRAAL